MGFLDSFRVKKDTVVSMSKLWLGSEESLELYAELHDKFASMTNNSEPSPFALSLAEERASDFGVSDSRIGLMLLSMATEDTATLDIGGSLVNGHQWWHEYFIGQVTSYDAIRDAVNILESRKEIKNVVLSVNSGGGSAMGVQSAGKSLEALAKQKNVIGHTDTMAASAGYWLLSTANEVNASSMAEVGSIGVIAIYEDYTKMMEEMGIKYHVIKAGKYKGVGFGGTEFSDEELEYLQDNVNKTYNFFLTHVSKQRGLNVSKAEKWADAQMFFAGEAKSVGLVDKVKDLSDLIKSVTSGKKGKNGSKRADSTSEGVTDMTISAEKLAQLELGADPETVLTTEELALWLEQQQEETNLEATSEGDEDEQPEGEGEADEADGGQAEEEGKSASFDLETVKALGRAEAKLEASAEQISALKAEIEAQQLQIVALKEVAQAAVTNLQIALQEPREKLDNAADIVEQYAGLKEKFSRRIPVGRQSSASQETKDIDLSVNKDVPNPLRPH